MHFYFLIFSVIDVAHDDRWQLASRLVLLVHWLTIFHYTTINKLTSSNNNGIPLTKLTPKILRFISTLPFGVKVCMAYVMGGTVQYIAV